MKVSQHPPRPRLTLNVGITGHRANAIDQAIVGELGQQLDAVLGALKGAVASLQDDDLGLFSNEAPQLRFHTALATGADQIAAQSARRCCQSNANLSLNDATIPGSSKP